MKLKQLSENLGLSQTTVSRALNGYPEVSESTRRRVQRAAAAGNYRPDLRATRLATGKAYAIGHVVPMVNKNDVINPIFAEFIAAASLTYANYGYELMLRIARTEDEESIYRKLASSRSVDGVVVHSPLLNDPRLPLLKSIGLPFVIHGRVPGAEDYSWVCMDNQNAFKQATKLLIDLGHRRIALLNGQEAMTFAWLRRAGYEEAHGDNRLDLDESLITSDDLTEPYGYQAAKEMLALSDPPTAFLVSSYVVALGVRRAVERLGLTIGKDVSIIIHDDELSYFDNSGVTPQFTATRSSVRNAGVKAATMLIEKIRNPDNPPESHMMETQLVIGSSTGPCCR